MREIPVKISNEHLKRVSQCNPVDALVELIWNSLDAGANKIKITINRNQLGGVTEVEVADNGCGISPRELKETFGILGLSPKKKGGLNLRGQPIHGKLGEGRFKAYKLGTKVEWKTQSKGSKEIVISGNIEDPSKFVVKNLSTGLDKLSGTHFKAINEYSDKLNLPGNESLINTLTIFFAPKLLADTGVTILVDGTKLNPSENIDDKETTVLPAPFEKSKVKTVIWKKGKYKELNWCDNNFFPRGHGEADLGYDLSYSIFIASPVVEKAVNENTLAIPKMTKELDEIKVLALDIADKFLSTFARSKISQVIQKLKDRKVYPYEGGPKSKFEHHERNVFDVCTTKIIESIPALADGNKDTQRLTLQLLKQAIETSPSALKNVLEKVLNLSKEDIEQLSRLLETVTLEGLIKLGTMVNERLSFLVGFEQLVFDPTWKKHVKERKHLHKILEQNTWIFNEQYALGTSDETLNSVLEYHKNLLKHGEDNCECEEGDSPGMLKIPDMVR